MKTKKKNFKLAAELLKLQFGYKDGTHSENLYFDFIAKNERIEVFTASSSYEDTFYWPEEITKIAEVCGLSCHVVYKKIKEVNKVIFVLH